MLKKTRRVLRSQAANGWPGHRSRCTLQVKLGNIHLPKVASRGAGLKEQEESQALVAHTCDLSCLGGRDQEDCGSKPAQANSSQDLISRKPITKKGLEEWLK
jgi:hypothetical protein